VWPHDEHDPDYRLKAGKYFDALRDDIAGYRQLQGDYGKWLIASLLLVHTAALYALITTDGVRSVLGTFALWWFVGGLFLALLCGLVTWWNWELHVGLTERWANVNMLTSPTDWPKNEPSTDFWIKLTFWLSLVLGLLSAFALLGGAYHVWSILGTVSPPPT
jgi:hypothetical protein